jgi:adenosylcobalamin-dependent ribonucleoside-triphosphate reductase
MADELELPRSKAVTTIKPSGTLSKVMDTTEGLHRPLGRYIFNWIKFDKNDRLVEKLRDAQYSIKDDPYSSQNCLVCFPVDNGPGDWQVAGGAEVNLESAWKQLNRYKLMMDLYVEHNASVTISYSPEEIPDIVTWLYENWDSYVGVSFILRTDPTKTAEDLGYPYLPQEVVTRDEYDTYTQGLLPINIHGGDLLDLDECEGGACPIR